MDQTQDSFLLSALLIAALIVGIFVGGDAWARAREKRASQGGAITPLPADWGVALARRGVQGAALAALVDRLYSSAQFTGVPCRPERSDVFAAFRETPLANVQVVIVGQDPYLDAGKANGLAFSVRRGVPVPYSLSRIFDNLEKDTFIHFDRPDHGDLRAWARQGVLLLNSSLTVSADGSKHSREWASFVEAVLSVVNESAGPTVFLLWGDDANDLADRVGIDENRHLLVRSTHPRREQDSRYSRFSDTNPFSAANQFLIPRWRGPIDWNL